MTRNGQRLTDYLSHIIEAIERDLPELYQQIQKIQQSGV